MTELSDELLVAYVDGQLAHDQSKAIEQVLEKDEVAARRVEAMRVANTRLEAAFEAMLANEVTALTGRLGEEVGTQDLVAGAGKSSVFRQFGLVAIIGGAISLVLAGAVGGYALRGAPDAAALVPQAAVPIVTGALSRRAWQDDIIIAHALYGRDTLTIALESQKNLDLVRFQLSNAIGTDIFIPDLGDVGLVFKRAQILNRGDSNVAQIAYLPETGDPVALYARYDEGTDTEIAGRQMDGVSAGQWRQQKVTYLLVGRMPLPQMDLLAAKVRQQIADNNALTSDLTVPLSAADARNTAVDPTPQLDTGSDLPRPASDMPAGSSQN
ncbi:MAG: hypothetical protein OEM91_02540 [Hyphomicrobiales bacterium]|nr:hypothetical protein [Hyphomicrobiales bacterium]